MSAFVVLVIGAVLGAALVVAFGFPRGWAASRTVKAWELGLLYVDGRFAGPLEPGRHRTLGRRERLIVTLPRFPGFETVSGVEVTSADRLSYRLSAAIRYTIADPRAAHEGGYRAVLCESVSAALIRTAATRTLEALLDARLTLDATLVAAFPEPVCGCRIEGIVVTGVILPPELRRLYAQVEGARLEGQAALERARGEQAALRSLANAARMLKGNPELMSLRLLQALSASGGKGGATLVLGRGAFPGAGDAAPSGEEA